MLTMARKMFGPIVAQLCIDLFLFIIMHLCSRQIKDIYSVKMQSHLLHKNTFVPFTANTPSQKGFPRRCWDRSSSKPCGSWRTWLGRSLGCICQCHCLSCQVSLREVLQGRVEGWAWCVPEVRDVRCFHRACTLDCCSLWEASQHHHLTCKWAYSRCWNEHKPEIVNNF